MNNEGSRLLNFSLLSDSPFTKNISFALISGSGFFSFSHFALCTESAIGIIAIGTMRKIKANIIVTSLYTPEFS